MMSERRRLSASIRAPASDGLPVSSAPRTGTALGRRAEPTAMVSRMTGLLPHEPPMMTSSGSVSAMTAARTPLMA